MNIVHVITSLNQGGAEGALVRLICQSRDPSSHAVISLMDEGIYGSLLRANGVRVITLGARRGGFSVSAFHNLIASIRQVGPDVVQTWMYHADLLGGLAAKQIGLPVVWGVRHSDTSLPDLGLKTWLVAKSCALLSKIVPRKIVGCSQRSISLHRKFGYADRFSYIPNGFNVSEAIAQVQRSNGIKPPVFGHAARFHPIKGHADFLIALEYLKRSHRDFQVRMAGTSIVPENAEFTSLVPASVATHIDAIGPQSDMPNFYAGCDVFVLSSHGEAFPNVVAEAMLAGVPCIVTNVGDAAEIVGDTGWVVPPKDPQALAEAMAQALMAMADTEAWAARKAAARARIVAEYSMEKMQSRFEAAWKAAMEK